MQAGSPGRVGRRLAAILAADMVGYSRLMEADEVGPAPGGRRDDMSQTHRLAAILAGRVV